VDQPQYRNASGSAAATRRANAEPIEISDDEHEAAPIASASSSKPQATAGARREMSASDGAASAQARLASEISTAPSIEAVKPKAKTVNPTLQDADGHDDPLDFLVAVSPRPAGIAARLQSKTVSLTGCRA
jgi:hypothetical protein